MTKNADPNSTHVHTILVATDFSAAANRASDVAATLARKVGARLCLLHVFEPPGVLIPELALDPIIEQTLRERATQQLASAVTRLRGRGVVVEEQLRIDSPPDRAIAAVAGEVQAELVVMGSHGRRPLPRLLLGSVAERTLLHTTHPVLVVPESAATPLLDPTPGHRLRIAVGIDLSNSSRAAVDWLREFRRQTDCDVLFIHLYWPPAEYQRFGGTPPTDPFRPDSATSALLQRALSASVGVLPGNGETTFQVLPNWGPEGTRLADEAATAQADLLVLGTHHRHGMSRLLRGATVPPALHAGKIPILCVSTSARPATGEPLPRLRTVVVATDLAKGCERLIAHGYALARAERGTVHLLHVHEGAVPVAAFGEPPSSRGALTAAHTKELESRLYARVPADAAALGIATTVMILEGGKAADVICQTAERMGADAICVGNPQRGDSGDVAPLGSVASGVLKRANRPVLVVAHAAD